MPYKDKEKRNEICRKYRQNHKKQCAERQADYYDRNLNVYLLHACKARAKKDGIPFNLTKDDIIIPEFCPVFGIKLERGTKGFHESSPSLDKIKPKLGYVKGNVVVVSFKANRMKQNATIEELEQLAKFYRELETVDQSVPNS